MVDNFISSIDNDAEYVIHSSKSDNIEIMITDEANKGVNIFFDSLENRY